MAASCAWRRHIVHELHRRDRNQSARFTQLFTHYSGLLERANGIRASVRCSPSFIWTHQYDLRSVTAQLAYEVVELQHKLEKNSCVLLQQQTRLKDGERELQAALVLRSALQSRVESVRRQNDNLKEDYDLLLRQQAEAELTLRQEVERESLLLEPIIQSECEEARRMNNHDIRRSRASENLQSADRSKVSPDRSKVNPDRSRNSPNRSKVSSDIAPSTQNHTNPPQAPRIRSVSASSSTIFSALRGLFTKRQGQSLSSLDLCRPSVVCVSTQVPSRVLQILDPGEEGVHCVRFSRCAEVLATAGFERCIKLWDMCNGSLSVRAKLFGFTQSVTCIDFDQTGYRILASSYDKSASLWQLDDPVPKLTLTGHRRKVCASRFCSAPPLVVTGSADGSIRLWDVYRGYCTQVVEAGSHCSDLVCSDNAVYSGHFDSTLRLWDLRTLSCVRELDAQDKVTCLDLSADAHFLLSCCRDNRLHLFDLRGRCSQHTCFRADGFSCSNDSNKAVFSPDGGLVAGGSSDGAVYVWDVSTRELQTRLQDHHSTSVGGVSWSVSGRYFVSVDKCRGAILWSDV